MLLLKSCIALTLDIERLCELIRNNNDDVMDLFYKCDTHYSISRPYIKQSVQVKGAILLGVLSEELYVTSTCL